MILNGHDQMVNNEIRLLYSFQSEMEKLYIVKTRTGADWNSDHEQLIAKFRFKLRKTIRPFRYDLNQIPYGYTVEVTNRFKGLV